MRGLREKVNPIDDASNMTIEFVNNSSIEALPTSSNPVRSSKAKTYPVLNLYTIITKSEPRMFINSRGELVNEVSEAEFFFKENEAIDTFNTLDEPELFEIVTAKLDISGDSICQ